MSKAKEDFPSAQNMEVQNAPSAIAWKSAVGTSQNHTEVKQAVRSQCLSSRNFSTLLPHPSP